MSYETSMKRRYSRHEFTIAECLPLLAAGHKITCADGYRWFPPECRSEVTGSYMVSRAAFDHLRAHGLIEFEAKHPHYAVWRPTAKAQEGARCAAAVGVETLNSEINRSKRA